MMRAPANKTVSATTAQVPTIAKSTERRQSASGFLVLGLVLMSITVLPGAPRPAPAETADSDTKWANSVLQRLLTTQHARRPVSHFQSWPPTVEIV